MDPDMSWLVDLEKAFYVMNNSAPEEFQGMLAEQMLLTGIYGEGNMIAGVAEAAEKYGQYDYAGQIGAHTLGTAFQFATLLVLIMHINTEFKEINHMRHKIAGGGEKTALMIMELTRKNSGIFKQNGLSGEYQEIIKGCLDYNSGTNVRMDSIQEISDINQKKMDLMETFGKFYLKAEAKQQLSNILFEKIKKVADGLDGGGIRRRKRSKRFKNRRSNQSLRNNIRKKHGGLGGKKGHMHAHGVKNKDTAWWQDDKGRAIVRSIFHVCAASFAALFAATGVGLLIELVALAFIVAFIAGIVGATVVSSGIQMVYDARDVKTIIGIIDSNFIPAIQETIKIQFDGDQFEGRQMNPLSSDLAKKEKFEAILEELKTFKSEKLGTLATGTNDLKVELCKIIFDYKTLFTEYILLENMRRINIIIEWKEKHCGFQSEKKSINEGDILAILKRNKILTKNEEQEMKRDHEDYIAVSGALSPKRREDFRKGVSSSIDDYEMKDQLDARALLWLQKNGKLTKNEEQEMKRDHEDYVAVSGALSPKRREDFRKGVSSSIDDYSDDNRNVARAVINEEIIGECINKDQYCMLLIECLSQKKELSAGLKGLVNRREIDTKLFEIYKAKKKYDFNFVDIDGGELEQILSGGAQHSRPDMLEPSGPSPQKGWTAARSSAGLKKLSGERLALKNGFDILNILTSLSTGNDYEIKGTVAIKKTEENQKNAKDIINLVKGDIKVNSRDTSSEDYIRSRNIAEFLPYLKTQGTIDRVEVDYLGSEKAGLEAGILYYVTPIEAWEPGPGKLGLKLAVNDIIAVTSEDKKSSGWLLGFKIHSESHEPLPFPETYVKSVQLKVAGVEPDAAAGGSQEKGYRRKNTKRRGNTKRRKNTKRR